MTNGVKLELVRATPQNGLFAELEAEWALQLRQNEYDAPADVYNEVMKYAARVAAEAPQDPRYGIFLVVGRDETGSRSYEAFLHVNRAAPIATLRVTWNYVAPRYNFEEAQPEQVARIKTAMIVGALGLCNGGMRELKVYLGNAIDREYARDMVSSVGSAHPYQEIAVRGGWLHIKK